MSFLISKPHLAVSKTKQAYIPLALILSATFSVPVFSATSITVSSLAELAAVADDSDQIVTMTPGVYYMSNYFTGSVVSDNLAQAAVSGAARFIEFSGSDNIFNMNGVEIVVDTALMWDLGPEKSSELLLTGSQITINDLAIRDEIVNSTYTVWSAERLEYVTGNAPQAGLNTFDIRGTGNTLTGVDITTYGGTPYGVGDFCGKGADSNMFGADLRKHSSVRIYQATDVTIDNLTIDQHSFGHAIHMHESVNTTIKNSYLEASLRGADDMKNDISGCLYDQNFKSVWTNAVVPDGQMKSLSEDGIRTYGGSGSVTVDNVHIKNYRSCFNVVATKDAVINGGRAENCERGIYAAKNVQIGQTTPVEVDAKYGNALIVDGGYPEIDILLHGDESASHGTGNVAIIWAKGGNIKINRYNNEQRTIMAKIRVGSTFENCFTSGWTKSCVAQPFDWVTDSSVAKNFSIEAKVGTTIRLTGVTENITATTEVGTTISDNGSGNTSIFE